jgi:hypothetical protein
MQKIIYLFFLLMLLAILANAQVPGSISYQGFLTTNGVDPVTDGNYDLTFTFYNGSSPVLARGPINTPVSKGLFTVIIGGGLSGSTNEPIPLTDLTFWNRSLTVGIKIGAAAELTPRTTLTAVTYAFTAASVDNTHVQDLMDGTLSGSKVGTGISAANITTGTVSNAVLDDDLDDLVDGSLSGSKVGSGISATNITTGTLPSTVLDADLQDLADGSLDGSKIGSGISTANLTGTIGNTLLDADLQDLGDGSLTGSKVGTGINADNISTGTLPDARLESTVNVNALDVATGLVTVSSTGYTKLGGGTVSVTSSPAGAAISFPSIRVVKITGTCAAADATASVTITGITDAKVLSVDVIVDYGTNDFVHAGYTVSSGLLFNYYLQNGILYIRNITGSSSGLAGRPFKAIITYEE